MPSVRRYVLPIVTLTMGFQLLRVFIPSLAWYLRDTIGLSSLSLVPYAFGTFGVGLLAPWLWRLLGPRSALALTAGGVALARVAEQVSRDPAVDLWLSMAGVAAFVLFLPVYLGNLRASDPTAAASWTFGVTLGVAFDIGLHGAAGTLDLSWHPGPVPLLVTGLLGVSAVWAVRRSAPAGPDSGSDTGWPTAVPLLAIGPYLLLQLLIFQSSGWMEEVGRVPTPLGFFLVMLGNFAAVVGAWWGLARPATFRPPLAALAAAWLIVAVLLADRAGPTFLLLALTSQLLMGWGWGLVASRAAVGERSGLGRTGLALPLGMLVFLTLAFAYYVALDLRLPFPREAVLPFAAALLGGLFLLASRRPQPGAPAPAFSPLWLASGLLAVPLVVGLLRGPLPRPSPLAAGPVRVMTFNIHSAFGSAGRHDPEAIAQVIEESGAEIVALQEVSRVRLLDGGTDLAAWLSRRLGMPFLFRGEEEPIWGNAILSRFPVLQTGWGRLPDAGTLIARGFLWAEIDVGGERPLFLIATHLHHVEQDHHVRLQEVPVLLELWGGRPLTVLLGDLNAEPEWEEMQRITQAGLIDSWLETGQGEGYTWSAANPHKRIDYIWHTPDLAATRTVVIQTLSSDHLPVLAALAASP